MDSKNFLAVPILITQIFIWVSNSYAQDATGYGLTNLSKLSPKQRYEALTLITPAYRKEALRIVIEQANKIAYDLQLPEILPISQTNLAEAFICRPRLNVGFGSITTSNYNYSITVSNKFSYLTKRNLEKDYDQLAARYRWPLSQVDTNAAYQIAIQWLGAALMDVKRLNQCPHIEVNPWIPENANNYFVPLYRIYWDVKADPPILDNAGNEYKWSCIASVELFLPTKTLRSLRVEKSEYIVRPSVVITNINYLLSQTNTP